MIDLHAHLLPGLDDGPSVLAGAVAMADVAVAEGIAVMAATPHVRRDHPLVDPLAVAGAVAELGAELRRRGNPLEVVPGGEIGLDRVVELDDAALAAVTLGGNGRDLLVETPHGPLPSIFEEVVDGLARRGFRVVLAHPELNPDLQARPERLGALVGRGALVQLTAASLVPGRAPHRVLARRAVEAGWAHVVASDAHAADWRPPALAPARPVCGGELFDWLTRTAPAALLAGAELPPRPARPARPSSRRWWRR